RKRAGDCNCSSKAGTSCAPRLLTNGAPKLELVSGQLRALRYFNELRLTGRLCSSSVQRDPLSPRLRHVLRVLDADLAGATREEIGEVLLAEGRATERWQGTRGGARLSSR